MRAFEFPLRWSAAAADDAVKNSDGGVRFRNRHCIFACIPAVDIYLFTAIARVGIKSVIVLELSTYEQAKSYNERRFCCFLLLFGRR